IRARDKRLNVSAGQPLHLLSLRCVIRPRPWWLCQGRSLPGGDGRPRPHTPAISDRPVFGRWEHFVLPHSPPSGCCIGPTSAGSTPPQFLQWLDRTTVVRGDWRALRMTSVTHNGGGRYA